MKSLFRSPAHNELADNLHIEDSFNSKAANNRDVAKGGRQGAVAPPSKDKMIRFRNKIPIRQVWNEERSREQRS